MAIISFESPLDYVASYLWPVPFVFLKPYVVRPKPYTIGALIITSTIWGGGGPYCKNSIMGPKTLF